MNLFRILTLTIFAYTLISCGGAEERKAVYLEKAKLSIDAGEFDKARIELKNVLQIDPKDSKAIYQLGKVHELQQDFQKAYRSYLRAEKLNPDLLENQAKLGRIYLLLANQPEKAQEKVDFILSKEPANSYGLLLKAAIQLQNGKSGEAIEIVKEILIRDPGHFDSITFLATVYIGEKNYGDAINLLDASLKENQNNEKLNNLLATSLMASKNYERAELTYKEFIKRNPDNAKSYNNLAAFYNQTDDSVNAKKALRASIDNDPKDDERILTLIKYIRTLDGNDEAIKELKSYIAVDDVQGRIRLALAELLVLNDEKNSAIKVYNDLISEFTEDAVGVDARISLVPLYLDRKEFEKASEIIDDAISISPNNPRLNYLQAVIAIRDKDYEKAIFSLRIVNKESPENIKAFILLAQLHQQEGQEGLVKDTLNNAYQSNNLNADALLELAERVKRDVVLTEKIIDTYNTLRKFDYDGLVIKAGILLKRESYLEAYEIATTLIEKYPNKPAGYTLSLPYLLQNGERKELYLILETGYMKVENNRTILTLLTSINVTEKEFDIAERRLKAELSLSPDDAMLKLLLSKVYFSNEKIDAGKALLMEVVEADYKAEEPYLVLSEIIYRDAKSLQEVELLLLRGVKNVPSSLRIPLKLATMYESEKDYASAIDVYKNSLKVNPDNFIGMNNLLSLLSDYGTSKDELRLSLPLVDRLKESDHPIFLDTIGWVYYKLDDNQQAITYLAKAVNAKPKVNVFNYHLGMAYKKQGDGAQAKKYLEKSLSDKKLFVERELAETALKDL